MILITLMEISAQYQVVYPLHGSAAGMDMLINRLIPVSANVLLGNMDLLKISTPQKEQCSSRYAKHALVVVLSALVPQCVLHAHGQSI